MDTEFRLEEESNQSTETNLEETSLMSEEPQHVDQSENSSQQEANLHNETIQSYFENDETIPQESSHSDTSKENHEDQDKPSDDSIPLKPNGRKRKQNRMDSKVSF